MKQTTSTGNTVNAKSTNVKAANASNGRENASSKRAKYKHLKIRTVAADYLSNISLNGTNDVQTNKAYFEKVISNDFDCFLTLNKINLKPDQQTEFFKYYKQKLVMEKREKSRLNEFLVSEFDDDPGHSQSAVGSAQESPFLQSSPSAKSYVESIMSNKRQPIARTNTSIDVDPSASRKLDLTPTSNSVQSFSFSANVSPTNQFGKLSPVSASPTNQRRADIDKEACESDCSKKHAQPLGHPEIQVSNSNCALKTPPFNSSHKPLSSALLAVTTSSSASASSSSSQQSKLSSSKISKSPTESQALDNLTNLTQVQIAGDMNQNSKGIGSSSSHSASAATFAQKLNQSGGTLIGGAGSISTQGSAHPTGVASSRQYKRTISESSTESNYNTINSANSINRYGNSIAAWSNSKVAITKPTLYNSLKRLTNEKLLLTSNNSPLGIFSRLPFSINRANNKSDLNESFVRTRHMSVNKTNQPFQNYFIYDVFELLDLDIEEYTRSGIMSYCNLIDPTPHNRRSVFRRSNTVEDSQLSNKFVQLNNKEFQTEHEKIDEAHEDSSDKDEYQQFKKESSPHLHLPYHSEYLDDPQLTELTAGKNRTCLKFASYAVSIIDYVKPLELKKEINETFKEKFPYIQISLTKLRSIKREMVEIAFEASLDMVIVVQSYIFFEKLILQGLINKVNRKYLAANCLVLAAKLNDVTKKEINKLIDTIINKFRFDSRKEVTSYEFAIVVALEFNLVVKYETDFVNHYERLVNSSHYKKLSEQQLTSVNNSTSHNRTYND